MLLMKLSALIGRIYVFTCKNGEPGGNAFGHSDFHSCFGGVQKMAFKMTI